MKRAWLLMVIAVLATSCAGGDAVEVRVSAASSLQDVFEELRIVFGEMNPGADIVLNLGASSTLREQLLAGAPVDVYASADTQNMEIVAANLDIAPIVFATNTMAMAVPAGNPAGLSGLDDLAREELLVGLCADTVPCGVLARDVLANAAVVPSIDTNEPNARSLLTKIEVGELDVGIVYLTDVLGSTAVDSIPIPDESNVVTLLPLATLPGSGGAASSFVDLVLSDLGREILADHGFGAP